MSLTGLAAGDGSGPAPRGQRTAWIGGAMVNEDEAVAAAAALHAGARLPAIAGLVAEVDAIRAGIRLAERLGGFLAPLAAPDIYAALGPYGGSGSLETVPGEAFVRSDLVLALGQVAASAPLLAEIAAHPVSVGSQAGLTRAVICLGGEPRAAPTGAVMPLRPEGMAATIGHLRAVAGGRLAGDAGTTALADRLRAARFAVLIYDPAELGDLAIEMTIGLARDLSEAGRCFCLPLADPFQGRSVVQIAAWMAARGPATGFARGRPEHDPWRFDMDRAVAAGEVDAALWLASLPTRLPPWRDAIPTVALLPRPRGDEARIVFAVAEPGTESEGALWHARRGAIVHHGAAPGGTAPAAAGILARLERAVSPSRAAPC